MGARMKYNMQDYEIQFIKVRSLCVVVTKLSLFYQCNTFRLQSSNTTSIISFKCFKLFSTTISNFTQSFKDQEY